ncbi:hypothetical protein BD289DRAFT_209579 [Coniella lustricola]|uniref:Uncharacterized protein n=1 Tax=Coniella lustricola TaxID=2025994 RepID=A0A2T2ZSA6_9PEZI|nr:hypothetical protein BD289DRAFT_209579 [Coniella lustricola]
MSGDYRPCIREYSGTQSQHTGRVFGTVASNQSSWCCCCCCCWKRRFSGFSLRSQVPHQAPQPMQENLGRNGREPKDELPWSSVTMASRSHVSQPLAPCCLMSVPPSSSSSSSSSSSFQYPIRLPSRDPKEGQRGRTRGPSRNQSRMHHDAPQPTLLLLPPPHLMGGLLQGRDSGSPVQRSTDEGGVERPFVVYIQRQETLFVSFWSLLLTTVAVTVAVTRQCHTRTQEQETTALHKCVCG